MVDWWGKEWDTKKSSQDISRTLSRLLGALSKLDEFVLNPEVRTLSGTVPRTFRNNGLESQEPTGDRSQSHPYPEVELSAVRCGKPIAQTQNRPLTWWEEINRRFSIAPLVHHQSNKRRRAPHLSHCSAVRTPRGILKQTRFCWPFNNWQASAFVPTSTKKVTGNSKPPKFLTMTVHTFDRKSEKSQMLEDLFQTSLRIHNQLTEQDKIKSFLSLVSKPLADRTKKIWEKIWRGSGKIARNTSQWLQ